MSGNTAIRVTNVSKSFRLPHQKHGSIKNLFFSALQGKRRTYEKQEVLKEISFEIKKGEFFGIVGRNGSGKSTLLKLLAGIYSPDKGHIQINGKLTPFIELGVGFDPDLTGRENVFLNGALFGFSRSEMEEMYDEIVQFAELENFMDQKLKNYSSGMQVRLAFSIAIRANTDILVLDEVLAVGDEAFQRKCNEYFNSIKQDKTKTIILVTHSMDAVRKYCDRAALIKNGKIVTLGSPQDIANEYTQENLESTHEQNSNKLLNSSNKVPYFKITSESKRVLSKEDDLIFNVEYEITDNTPVHVFFSIIDEKRGGSILANGTEPISKKGKHKLTYVFPLTYYNDCDLLVVAALDESETRRRIAITSTSNSCRFAIRNEETDNGLLRRDNGIHGHWVDHKDYMYSQKEA